MSDLRARLRALRGEDVSDELRREASPAPREADPHFGGPAAQLRAEVVRQGSATWLLRRERWASDARHGDAHLGGPDLDGRLRRWAARGLAGTPVRPGQVVYLDAETTGLSGGTGTLAFLVGLGVHDDSGFMVEQYFLPGPEHEPTFLTALAERLRGAAAIVSFNGASFDLPLLRTRFALHGIDDPTREAAHLDLLPLARRLWRERLPDCRLATIERQVLRAERSTEDVPGAEVPARYLAFLRSRDAHGLRGVLEHNRIDIVALTALRVWLEARLEPGVADDPEEAYGLGRWLAAAGDEEAALGHLLAAEDAHDEARWEAARLLRRHGRIDDAVTRWRALADADDPRGWIELAKHLEHRERDPRAALAAAERAERLGGHRHDDLERRLARLSGRVQALAATESG